MAKGYWIVRVDITDMEQYKTYVAANAAPLAKYGARFLVRGGPFEKAILLREPVSTADLVIIEGYEGAQPSR